MDATTEIRRVAIVGAGLIGSSWAACFLARGLDVAATDPAPGAEETLRRRVEGIWPDLVKLGLAPGASTARLRFAAGLEAGLEGADFVQENGPEREPLKIELFAAMDALLPPPALLASSSSGILMSRIQSGCAHPERCILGHPYNPPHLMPLVEVVGGTRTSAEAIERTLRFYTAIGKRPLRLHKEVKGHVANRLQAALYREVVHLIDQGVISVADIDTAVCSGPGLRWALMGPNLIFHLGGGPGGMPQFLAHFTRPLMEYWADLGSPNLANPDLQKKIVDGVLEEVAGRSFEALSQERDALLLGLLALLAHRGNPEAATPAGEGIV